MHLVIEKLQHLRCMCMDTQSQIKCIELYIGTKIIHKMQIKHLDVLQNKTSSEISLTLFDYCMMRSVKVAPEASKPNDMMCISFVILRVAFLHYQVNTKFGLLVTVCFFSGQILTLVRTNYLLQITNACFLNTSNAM